MNNIIMASAAIYNSTEDQRFATYGLSLEAIKQWTNLRNAIISCGAKVEVIPASESGHTSTVYISQSGFEFDNLILPGKSAFYSDESIEQYYITWFLSKGFTVTCSDDSPREQISYAGSQDTLFEAATRRVWFGINYKSTLEFKRYLDIFLEDTDVTVFAVELIDPLLNTLNKCFCLLDTGDLLWYPNAFSEHSRYRIESMFEGRHIPISKEDAENLVCQSISIDRNIITSGMTRELEMNLDDANFNVITVDLSEFVDCNHSCSSLILKVSNK